MASQTDVANMALGRLRVGQTIADIADENTPARICLRFIDQCRQEVLRAFPWNFAFKTVQLSEVADQTFPGWEFVYAYPDDCLMCRAVSDASGLRYVRQLITSNSWSDFNTFSSQQPFQIALKDDAASRVILSDVESAYAFYTVDVEGVGLMPPDFVNVWAWRLAMEVGGPLQADDASVQRAAQNYAAWLTVAAAQSMNESRDDPRQDSPSIECRY